MSEDVAKKNKQQTQQSQAVANMQQIIEYVANNRTDAEALGKVCEVVAAELLAYAAGEDVPIIAEFCARLVISEKILLALATQSATLATALDVVDTKKRASLERRIYSTELNATIGANLLKSWREQPITIEQTTDNRPWRYKDYPWWMLDSEKSKMFIDLTHECLALEAEAKGGEQRYQNTHESS